MRIYDPLGANRVIPKPLELLRQHPERATWRAAILLYTKSGRWPGWPYEIVLATVDTALQVHVGNFLIRPPFGWQEDEQQDYPPGVSPARLVHEGLSPAQAMTILNEILGKMLVFSNSYMSSYKDWACLERGSGKAATWKLASLFTGIADDLRVSLNDDCAVSFQSPLRLEGTLSERALRWAKGYASAQAAQRLLIRALGDRNLTSAIFLNAATLELSR